MRRFLVLTAVIGVSLASRAGHAQVNIEPLRSQIAEKGIGGRLAASVSSYAGNTQGVILGSSAFVGARLGPNTFLLTLSGDYARLNHAVSVAKWFGHVRHNYQLASRLWWEEFFQLESDRFRRVTFRRLLGTGPRVQLLAKEGVELFGGVAYMLEHTNLDTEQTDSVGEGTRHRLSSYLAFTLRAHDRVVITSVTYIQPRLDELSDFRVLNVNQADFQITERLHSRLNVTFRYDSLSPADVTRTDLEMRNALEILF